nr:trypsin-like peptidase domain-containing protein [Micromonospora sp. DSM 115978]
MNEYETDPQRPPASADAEQSHHTAELPSADQGTVGSTATPTAPGADPGRAIASDDPARPVPSGDPARPVTGAPAGHYAPNPWQAPPSAAQPGQRPDGQPGPGGGQHPGSYAGPPAPSHAGGYALPSASHHPGQPAAQYPGQPGSHYARQYPGQPAGQYPGQPGVGHPGQPPAGYPGQPGSGPHPAGQYGSGPYPGGQPPHQAGPPPWHRPLDGQPQRPPSRVGRAVAVGVAALVLMAGSGIAGGVVALAFNEPAGTGNRTFTAAPIISEADLPGIAASVENSVVSISTGSAEGSGVVLSADGFVLTNNHVVASAGDTVRVIFADGKSADAQVIGTDPKTDLAVLKADGVSDLAPATFGDSDAIRVGDTVLALGSPLGLQGSVTAGIISSLNRTIQAGDGGQTDPSRGASSISGLLQTDAPINPGNSGGALVNTRGEVIGINTAIATSGQSNGNIGVGFAIPSNKAKAVAEALQRGEKVSHPYLGVSVTASDDGGAVVGTVTPDSPAAKAGLQRGDVVTRFGETVINDSNDLVSAVQAGKVGDVVEVAYTRNGAEMTATVTLAETS